MWIKGSSKTHWKLIVTRILVENILSITPVLTYTICRLFKCSTLPQNVTTNSQIFFSNVLLLLPILKKTFCERLSFICSVNAALLYYMPSFQKRTYDLQFCFLYYARYLLHNKINGTFISQRQPFLSAYFKFHGLGHVSASVILE